MSGELVLVADDEPISREFLSEALAMQGLVVTAVADGRAAMETLRTKPFDYVVTDLQMPEADGIAVLTESKLLEPDRPVILVTAHGTMGVAIDVMRRGADDILEKPVTVEDLELAMLRARERVQLRSENRYLRNCSVGDDLLVRSVEMEAVLEVISRVAASTATVLIQGESGTGKERVAGQVHKRSDRADGPFVKINCAAIAENLMESELFGHEVGAFTGASKRRQGCFELADGGTLFLDEVGEMTPSLQVRLLRVLQEGELTRVGGSRTIRVDVRIVAASNRDLEADVEANRFRGDLFYRLNVVPVVVPPLRQRRVEIGPLAEHFLHQGVRLADDALEILESHDWPGNVRELQNLMQRASLLCNGQLVDAGLLRPWLGVSHQAEQGRTAGVETMVGRSLRDVEAELIQRTLASCDGNRTRAAEVLGIGVRTLFNKLRDAPLAPRN